MISWWQHILSYFIAIRIDQKYSEYSGELDLSIVNGTIQLATENAIYSHGKRYYNYEYCFHKLDISSYPIKKVLVLGYGLGSVSELLAPYFDRLDIDGIEIDQEIIDWEVEYGFEKEQFNINITQADAINWMDKTEEKYDLILLDLFIDNIVPADFETPDFLGKLAMRLNTKGLVLFNRLSFTQSLKDQTETVFQTMKQVFPNSYQLPIKGNTMIVSSKN